MVPISKDDVVQWLHAEAEKHQQIADAYTAAAIKAELADKAGTPSSNGTVAEDEEQTEPPATLTVDAVAAFLRGAAKRKPEIADHFGIDVDALDEIVNEENGFRRGERGWWSFAGEN